MGWFGGERAITRRAQNVTMHQKNGVRWLMSILDKEHEYTVNSLSLSCTPHIIFYLGNMADDFSIPGRSSCIIKSLWKLMIKMKIHFMTSVYGMMATKTHDSTGRVHIISPLPPKAASDCTILWWWWLKWWSQTKLMVSNVEGTIT